MIFNRTLRNWKQRQGYVALITVTLVMTTVVMVGIVITLMSANSLVSSLLRSQGTQAYYVADSCAYESLLRLKRVGLGYVGDHTLAVGDNTCTIRVTHRSGTIVDVLIQADQSDTAYRQIVLVVDTANDTVLLWQEAQ